MVVRNEQLFLCTNPYSILTHYVTFGKTYKALHDLPRDYGYDLMSCLIPPHKICCDYKALLAYLCLGQACSDPRAFVHAAFALSPYIYMEKYCFLSNFTQMSPF